MLSTSEHGHGFSITRMCQSTHLSTVRAMGSNGCGFKPSYKRVDLISLDRVSTKRTHTISCRSRHQRNSPRNCVCVSCDGERATVLKPQSQRDATSALAVCSRKASRAKHDGAADSRLAAGTINRMAAASQHKLLPGSRRSLARGITCARIGGAVLRNIHGRRMYGNLRSDGWMHRDHHRHGTAAL